MLNIGTDTEIGNKQHICGKKGGQTKSRMQEISEQFKGEKFLHKRDDDDLKRICCVSMATTNCTVLAVKDFHCKNNN